MKRITYLCLYTFSSLCLLASARTQISNRPIDIAPTLARLEGVDVDSGIAYARIFLKGVLMSTSAGIGSPNTSTPLLIAQCTQDPGGKLSFDLFVNYGNVEDTAFHRPWRSGDKPPAPIPKVMMVMEFSGYTHTKPIKRQWQKLLVPTGQFHYNSPSLHSSNLEDATFYLQYLKSLPTLRLMNGAEEAEFHALPWLDQLRKEPLCKAGGL